MAWVTANKFEAAGFRAAKCDGELLLAITDDDGDASDLVEVGVTKMKEQVRHHSHTALHYDVPLVRPSLFFLSCLSFSTRIYTTHNYLDQALTRAHTHTHTQSHTPTNLRQIRLVQLVTALLDELHARDGSPGWLVQLVPGIRPSLLRALLRWQGKFPLCYVISLLIGAGFILFISAPFISVKNICAHRDRWTGSPLVLLVYLFLVSMAFVLLFASMFMASGLCFFCCWLREGEMIATRGGACAVHNASMLYFVGLVILFVGLVILLIFLEEMKKKKKMKEMKEKEEAEALAAEAEVARLASLAAARGIRGGKKKGKGEKQKRG